MEKEVLELWEREESRMWRKKVVTNYRTMGCRSVEWKVSKLGVIFEVILTGCSPFEIRNLVLRLALSILGFIHSRISC